MRAVVMIAAVVGFIYVYVHTLSWQQAGAASAAGVGLAVVASAFLHPYVRCGACKGSGRHVGAVFNYAWRPCHVCNGAGRKQRLSAHWLGRGQRTRSGSRIVPATRSFGGRR